MKKIIAAFDGLKFSDSTKAYAAEIARQEKAHLVGVFLEDFTYHSYKIYDLIREDDGSMESKQAVLEKKDMATRAAAVRAFENACQSSRVEYSIHRDRNIALKELLHESIYADLLIIDSHETLSHYSERLPTQFIRDLLGEVHCPVLSVPHSYKPIKRVVMLYDGDASSVYAIKMLSYTLPALRTVPVEVLSVKRDSQSLHLPDNRLMKEFMKRHFPNTSYLVLKGIAETEITGYFTVQKEPALLTLGAYQRGKLSRWLKESMADVLMKDLKLPLFIAHNK